MPFLCKSRTYFWLVMTDVHPFILRLLICLYIFLIEKYILAYVIFEWLLAVTEWCLCLRVKDIICAESKILASTFVILLFCHATRTLSEGTREHKFCFCQARTNLSRRKLRKKNWFWLTSPFRQRSHYLTPTASELINQILMKPSWLAHSTIEV